MLYDAVLYDAIVAIKFNSFDVVSPLASSHCIYLLATKKNRERPPRGRSYLSVMDVPHDNKPLPLSGLYAGSTTHTRVQPAHNTFTYGVYMAYVDLDELCAGRLDNWPIFSSRSPYAITSLLQRDHMIHENMASNLAIRVRDFVQRCAHHRPTGPIRLLTNLRILGVEFNPVSFYYIFAPDGTTLDLIVAEVANFPWFEQHSYLLTPQPAPHTRDAEDGLLISLAPNIKQFHVSPFMPVHGLRYGWLVSCPDRTLSVRITMRDDDDRLTFFATVHAHRVEWTVWNLLKMQVQFPWHSLHVMVAILYEATKMFRNGFAFFPHPTGATTRLSQGVERVVTFARSATELLSSVRLWRRTDTVVT